MWEDEKCISCLIGKAEGRLSRRLGSNIQMVLREVDCDDVDWINLAEAGAQWQELYEHRN